MNINTNTIVSILIALVLFYIFIKVAESIGKLIVLIVFVGAILFGVQSLGICNIPIMNKIYPEVTKVIPYKQIWSNYSVYRKDFDKSVKIRNGLK
jgi:predicted RND superfamily exporter protein